MTTEVLSQEEIIAQMNALYKTTEESSKFASLESLKTEGLYRIRILTNPGDPVKWFGQWGVHFYKKGIIGNEKPIIFVSDVHTNGAKQDKMSSALLKAKNSGNPALESLAEELYSGAQFVVNAMLLGNVGMSQEQVGEIVQLKLNATILKSLFSFARMVNHSFMSPKDGQILHINVKKRTQGFGMAPEVYGSEQACDLTEHINSGQYGELRNLSEVIAEQISNAKSLELFTGDILAPLAAVAAAPMIGQSTMAPPAQLAAPGMTAQAQFAAPGITPGIAPIVAAAPVAAQMAAPMMAAPVSAPITVAPPVTQTVAPTPMATPQAMPVIEAAPVLAGQVQTVAPIVAVAPAANAFVAEPVPVANAVPEQAALVVDVQVAAPLTTTGMSADQLQAILMT